MLPANGAACGVGNGECAAGVVIAQTDAGAGHEQRRNTIIDRLAQIAGCHIVSARYRVAQLPWPRPFRQRACSSAHRRNAG